MSLFKPTLSQIPLTILLLITLMTAGVQSDQQVSLNLKDADIKTLIETVSELTGKNFIIDPRVKARVTVISARPMNKQEIYQVFLSVLQVHGYATVEVGEIIKILPDVNAKQGAGQVATQTIKGDELVTRIIELEHIAASQIVPILRPLIPQQGHLAAYPQTNVIIISDRGANISRLERIIARIDQPSVQDIEVIQLQHASASEVVGILNSLKLSLAATPQSPNNLTMAADDRTNSILLSGEDQQKVRVRGLIAHLDTPIEGTGNTRVVYLHYAEAETIAPILQGVSSLETREGAASASSDVNIQADNTNNALIITAPPAQFESLRRVIDKLDVRRAQVLVEAIIAEVSTDLTKELGVEGFLRPTGDSDNGITLSTLNTANIADNAGLTIGLDNFTSGTRWGLLVRALESDTTTNILSTPTLVTLDNEEAEIVVAQNVPFITGSYSNESGSTDPFQTIERHDVGLTLTITPQINEGNSIQLKIEQESSSISNSSVASDIITNERRISTSVMIDDREILVLGGLTQDDYRETVSKTPLLGDLPVLGNLFRSNSTTKTKQNLMVFIRPVILRNSASANLATESKYEFLRASQLEAQTRGAAVNKNKHMSLLPNLNDLVTQVPTSIENSVPANNQLMPQPPTQ